MKEKEIVTKDHPKFMESNVTSNIKTVIKDTCRKLYNENIRLWYRFF